MLCKEHICGLQVLFTLWDIFLKGCSYFWLGILCPLPWPQGKDEFSEQTFLFLAYFWRLTRSAVDLHDSAGSQTQSQGRGTGMDAGIQAWGMQGPKPIYPAGTFSPKMMLRKKLMLQGSTPKASDRWQLWNAKSRALRHMHAMSAICMMYFLLVLLP